MKKEIANDEIVKMIEREQVISYKKKNQHKPTHKQSKEDQQDFQSAQSLKSNVFSEDSVRFYKKNTPLPELGKDRRRLIGKNLAASENRGGTPYLDKQVRQHDNLVLKQQNNQLATQNMKLKTKLMTLEKENIRLQKLIQQDSLKVKVSQQVSGPKEPRLFKINPQASSMKMLIRNIKKELQDVKRENTKIKWSIKFTRINELQCERDSILEETIRLRNLIEEEIGKRANIKIKQHGLSNLESRVTALQERNSQLTRENTQLQKKLKKLQQTGVKIQKFSQNEKNLNKMLFNARRVIREKEKEIQQIKSHTNVPSMNSIVSQKNTESAIQSAKDTSVNQKKQLPGRRLPSKQKRIMSKSAQKYRSSVNKGQGDCENCKRLSDQNNVLLRKIEELTQELKSEKDKTKKALGQLSKGSIPRPKDEAIQTVGRFLAFRFKAHHLSSEQAQKYLISSENSTNTSEQITVGEAVQSLVAQPFSLFQTIYLEAMIVGLFYANDKAKEITFNETKKMKKDEMVKNFRKIVKSYELMNKSKEEQMFIQIAELITNYHQHILTALNGKRNGEGTIAEADLTFFFNEIELQKQYVDFIITQIILESYDLAHLNYYAMFEIFYMPTQELSQPETQSGGKKKFEVDHVSVVKQEDEEYQESRSYVDTKQKTQSRRQQDQDSEEEPEPLPNKKKVHSVIANRQAMDHQGRLASPKANVSKNSIPGGEQLQEEIVQNTSGNRRGDKTQLNNEDYDQQFEEQKMQEVREQEKMNENKPYELQEEVDEYQEEFQN